MEVLAEVLRRIESTQFLTLKALFVENGKNIANVLPKLMGSNAYDELLKDESISNQLTVVFSRTRESKEKYLAALQGCKAKIKTHIENKKLEQLNKSIIYKCKEVDIKSDPISGEELQVKIVYYNKKMNVKHAYGKISLPDQTRTFVKKFLGKNVFPIVSPLSELRVLQFKEEITDQYTGNYQFDPFFKSLKFILSMRDKTKKLTKNFHVTNSEKVRITESVTDEDWGDQEELKLSDPSQKLIDQICKKEQAGQDTKQYLMKVLNQHHMIYIKDLVYNPKQVVKHVGQQKWANVLEAAILKVSTPKIKEFDGNQNDENKKFCYKTGNAHKILRFLYFKNRNDEGLGLKQLKLALPWILDQVLTKAVNIIRNQLLMDRVFDQIIGSLKNLTLVPTESELRKLKFPYGMLFYGPPGTGKTRLTEDLMQLVGFHPISRGLSSSQFMKELVGQSKGMVQSLLFRPKLSKHLACNLSIDQIDAIVGNRNDSNNKNSGQATSMFLSALGGNQAIQNILVMGSTNYKNKIDDAIARRLQPNIYVGLPNENARAKILEYYMIEPAKHLNQIKFLSEITLNFSGAAIQTLCMEINKKIKLNQKITSKNLLQITRMTAEYYKIKLGDETYPDLRDNFRLSLNEAFMRNVFKNTVVINKKNETTYGISFVSKEKQWMGNRSQNFLQIKDRQISISLGGKQGLDKISEFFNLGIGYNIVKIESNRFKLSQYKDPTLVLIKADSQYTFTTILEGIYTNKQKFDERMVYIGLYYEAEHEKEELNVKFCIEMYQNSLPDLREITKEFTGRILIDLSKQTRNMEFQLSKSSNQLSQGIYKSPLLSGEGSSKTALAEVIDYFMMHNVGVVQVINYKFLVDNSAIAEDAIVSLINTKVDEVAFYQKAAVIIELDDLVSINRSFSKSQTGPNQSISINQVKIFRSLVILINKLAKINAKKEVWVAVIMQNQELAQMLRKEVYFPQTFQQKKSKYEAYRKQQEEQEKKNRVRTCNNCHQLYTQQENQKEKKCVQHFGFFCIDKDATIIKDRSGFYLEQEEDASYFLQICNQTVEKDKKMVIKYTCCWRELGSAGCRTFKHFQGEPDQLNEKAALREKNQNKWETHCKKLREIRVRVLQSAQDLGRKKVQDIYNQIMAPPPEKPEKLKTEPKQLKNNHSPQPKNSYKYTYSPLTYDQLINKKK